MEPKLFLVKWRDACGGANVGWRTVEELQETKEATVLSCGVILHRDEQRVLICPHVLLDDKGQVEEGDAELAIPMDWVTSIQELRSYE